MDACKPEDTGANGQPIVPCGLIAWSLFNDTYSFSRNSQNLTVNKKGISWKSDREHKFGKDVYPKNFQNGTLIGGAHLNDSKPVSFPPVLDHYSFFFFFLIRNSESFFQFLIHYFFFLINQILLR